LQPITFFRSPASIATRRAGVRIVGYAIAGGFSVL
jgi:hypothetical protein